ncbi:MAG: hypothetical protein ABJB12_17520 [Pseudomonadota bacterium]
MSSACEPADLRQCANIPPAVADAHGAPEEDLASLRSVTSSGHRVALRGLPVLAAPP